tara:strand:+ start:8709 stop:10250 length:1542 start_codon:yes stop_codon:yes gene_type:complete
MREDWIECTLGELITITSGNAFKKSEYSNKGVRLFQIANVSFNETSWDKIAFLPDSYLQDEKYQHLVLKKGDIVMALNRPMLNRKLKISQLSVIDVPAILYQRVGKFNMIDELQPKYLLYYLQSPIFIKWLSEKLQGVNIPFINQSKLLSYNQFPFAVIPIQKAIVKKIEELFSSLDSGIADLKKAQGQLVIYRQAVLKKAFEGDLTKEWREKQTNLPSAFELLELIKEERQNYYDHQITNWKEEIKLWENKGKEEKKPLKPKKLIEISNLAEEELGKLESLPNQWVYSYLTYAGELARGKSKHRPRNDTKLFENGKYPFIQTGDVKAQKIIKEFHKKYSDFGLLQSKLWKKGTLCITIAANIAETGFLGIDACFPDSIVGFTPFKIIIKDQYIEYFFQLAKNRISAYAPATAQKNINLTILENLVVPFCSKQEQHQIILEIESRLSVCDKVEESIKESLLKAQALRQSILKKAFDGKLLSVEEIKKCKQHKEYEPASVLLEKIKKEKLRKKK